MYGKWFATAYTGSMIGAGAHVFAVWGWVIANAGPDGVLEINPPLLAAMIGEPVERIGAALDYLTSPDPKSRSKAEGGRRLLHLEAFSYSVVNHAEYRAIKDQETRRQQNREAKRRQRERERAADNTDSQQGQPSSAHTEGRDRVHKQKAPNRDSAAEAAEVVEWSPEVIEIAQYLYDAIAEHSPELAPQGPKAAKTILGWCKDIDQAMRNGTRLTGERNERGFTGPNMTVRSAKAAIDQGHRHGRDWYKTGMRSGAALRRYHTRLLGEAKAGRGRRGNSQNAAAQLFKGDPTLGGFLG